MALFDQALIDRLNTKYCGKRFSKPQIAFLATDPKAAMERLRIQDWFCAIPEKSKPNVKGRLISDDDTQHFSALNELVVARLLSLNALEHEFEPEVPEGDPDFLVKTNNPFYIELASVFQLENSAKEGKKINTLLDELSKIEHYYFLSISQAVIPNTVKYRDIKDFVCKWMDSFDSETFSDIQETNYNRQGLKLHLTISPKTSKTKGSIIGAWMLPVTWVSADHVSRAIKKKIQKYKSIKEMDFPYVVAIALEDDMLNMDDIIDVLFGKEIVVVNTNTLQVIKTGRDNSGLLTPRRTNGLIENTRLSAILTIRKKWSAEGLRMHNFTIIHNPFAKKPLSRDIFSRYPQFLVTKQTCEKMSLSWTMDFNRYDQI